MSDHGATTPEADSAARFRRSGRVSKAPQKFADDAALSTAPKRKRAQDDADDDADDPSDTDDQSSADDNASSAASDDDPEATPKPRRPAGPSRPRKPGTKKPRPNGASATQFNGIPTRPKKSVRIDAGGKGSGLFVDVFASGDSPDAVAQAWLEKYRADETTALTDLVNCIIQCVGCEQLVTEDDIRDEENIPNRLEDLENVYQEQGAAEYPLIAKAKSVRNFRDILLRFFRALVHALHESDVLYKDKTLIDTLQAWLASMSSGSLRSFRHTATTISLAVQSSLVDVAETLDTRIASAEHQLSNAKRTKNTAKETEIRRNLDQANEARDFVETAMQSFFDVVFVHRYRDVEPKIRTECVEALGYWIWTLPTVFLDPTYLRYLGWELSDQNAATRHQVLKQLQKLFRRDSSQLGHFLDRFRPRLIEIATSDVDISCQVAGIAVIDALRASALLEPSEIDAIGILIFDREVRIRKAVVNFFTACVDDAYESKLNDMGGADVLEDLKDGDDEDYTTPRREWVTIKCLAETLAVYDAQIQERQHDEAPSSLDIAVGLLDLKSPETNVARATSALHEKVSELRRWETLAGYLLFDHTTSTKSRSKPKGEATDMAFKRAVAPSPEEETLLLNVLAAAVQTTLEQAAEAEKSRKKGPRTDADQTEDLALELAATIPKLLNKFGAAPETAAICLKMEHALDLQAFQQLRQESSNYGKLLDEVVTQFTRHDDHAVLSEAAVTLTQAHQCDELEESVDVKLAQLWEQCTTALRNSDKTRELFVRGNLEEAPLRDLITVVMKMSKLAGVSNCIETLEAEGVSDESTSSIIAILINIVHRGKFEPADDEDIDDLEDELVAYAIQVCYIYFVWKIREVQDMLKKDQSISKAYVDRLQGYRQQCRRYLIETFSSRVLVDQIRLFATETFCDMHLAFGSLRMDLAQREGDKAKAASVTRIKGLVQEIEPGLVPELLAIFDGAEKQYAKKARKDKTLNEPAEDEDPMVEEDEDDSDSDSDEDLSPGERQIAEAKAERALCDLTAKYVVAINNRLLDYRGPHPGKVRLRLRRNQAKLGRQYAQVAAGLHTAPTRQKQQVRKRHPNAKPILPFPNSSLTAGPAPQKPTPEAIEDDDDEREEEEENPFEEMEDEAQPEEGSREDLRRKELLEEDPIEDHSDDEAARSSNQGRDQDGDHVLGD